MDGVRELKHLFNHFITVPSFCQRTSSTIQCLALSDSDLSSEWPLNLEFRVPTAPGTLGLGKARQGEHSTASGFPTIAQPCTLPQLVRCWAMLDLIQLIIQTRRQKVALGQGSKIFSHLASPSSVSGRYPTELNLESNPSNAI